MKRTATTKRQAAARKAARPFKANRYADGYGIYFDEVRLWLPNRTSDWPRVRIVEDQEACEQFRRDVGMTCSLCDWAGGCDIHHLIGGSRGRCDSWTNLMPLCRKCHESIQSVPDAMRMLLRLKWAKDKPRTCWLRLTLLRGRWWDFDTLDKTEVSDVHDL